MKIRKLFLCVLSIISIIIVGCNNESYEIPDISNEYDLFVKNGITNVQAAYEYNINDGTLFHGLRNCREWFALFDSSTKNLLNEWYGENYSELINNKDYNFDSYIQNPICVSEGKYAVIKNQHTICNLNTNGEIEYQEVDSEILNNPYLTLISDKTIPVKGNGWFIENNTNFDFYYLLGIDGKLKVKNIFIQSKDEFNVCAGKKGDNLWVGLKFNGYSFEKIIENDSYNWLKKVYEGYGEYHEYSIIGFEFSDYYTIETKNGFALIPNFYIFYKNTEYSYDIGSLDFIWIINNENIIEVSVKDPHSLNIWYDGTVLVNDRYIISLNGEKLYEGTFPHEAHPISYTEYIEINNKIISRCSGISGEYTNGWRSTLNFVENYPDDSRFTYTIIEETRTEIVYCCDIVNYDGSKAQEKFKVNLTTGDITYTN